MTCKTIRHLSRSVVVRRAVPAEAQWQLQPQPPGFPAVYLNLHTCLPSSRLPQGKETASLPQRCSFHFCFGFHSFPWTNVITSSLVHHQVFLWHWSFPLWHINMFVLLLDSKRNFPWPSCYPPAAICFAQAQPSLLKLESASVAPFLSLSSLRWLILQPLPHPSPDLALLKAPTLMGSNSPLMASKVLFDARSSGLESRLSWLWSLPVWWSIPPSWNQSPYFQDSTHLPLF